jgi:hypothetical protein
VFSSVSVKRVSLRLAIESMAMKRLGRSERERRRMYLYGPGAWTVSISVGFDQAV